MSSSILEDMNVYSLLDRIGEGLIFADDEYRIIWINHAAKEILSKVGPLAGMADPEAFIGFDIRHFHGKKQNDILQNGPFPHSAQIRLFNRFTAKIVVDKLTNLQGEQTGFVLTWRDVTEYENVIEEGKALLEEMYTPIIGTALDSALLIALTGTLTEERMEKMKEKILREAAERRAEYMIFDFTGISETFDETIAFHLNQIAEGLRLIGTESIFAGMNPKLVQHIIHQGYILNVKTFQSFKQGIFYIWKEKGYALNKITGQPS